MTKMRNTLANNMSVDIKLSKAQIFKKVQSGGYFGSCYFKYKSTNKCCHSFR